MALAKDTLSTALVALAPQDNFPDAAEELAKAYGTYMKEAQAGAASMVAAQVDSVAVPAMDAVLASVTTGLASVSTIADFNLLLVRSMVDVTSSFWAAMVAAPGAFLPGATVITPPVSYSGLAGGLNVVLADNLATKASQADAMDAIAEAIHDLTVQQPTGAGTATFPGPVVSPIL